MAARAIEIAGEQNVGETVLAVEPQRQRDGSYRFDNVFRLAIAGA